MEEIWKDIEGYEGLYQVSNLGNVKTLSRKRVREHILKNENNKGYFVHNLVANAFKKNKSDFKFTINDNLTSFNIDDLEINHIDQNPNNNKSSNLEWCTHRYNLCYGDRRKKVIDKERKPVNQYTKNGIFIEQHYSIQQAARNIGRNAGPICRCCNGKQEFAYDYKWSYASKGGDE